MKLEPFAMERLQSTYEHQVDFNLSESGVEHAWKEYRRFIKKRLSSENF